MLFCENKLMWETDDTNFACLENEEKQAIVTVWNEFGKRRSVVNHEIGIEETFFWMKITRLQTLNLVDLSIVTRKTASLFRQYVVSYDDDGIYVLLSFYRLALKGNKPLAHVIHNQEIQMSNMEPELRRKTTLSESERKDAIEMMQQFCFVESYASGAITTSLKHQPDHYAIIFSNVSAVTSGFIKMYMNLFKNQNPSISFVYKPFEVHATILRKQVICQKRRLTDDSTRKKPK